MSDFDFEDVRRKVSALHFAKEALSEHERETLALAEQLVQEVDRLRGVIDSGPRDALDMS